MRLENSVYKRRWGKKSESENISDHHEPSTDSDGSADEEVDSIENSDGELSQETVSQGTYHQETSVMKQPLLVGSISDGSSVLSGKKYRLSSRKKSIVSWYTSGAFPIGCNYP